MLIKINDRNYINPDAVLNVAFLPDKMLTVVILPDKMIVQSDFTFDETVKLINNPSGWVYEPPKN